MNNFYNEREKKLSQLLAWQKENSIPMIVTLTRDSDPHVRAEALMALGYNADKGVYMHITPALEDEDQHVRYSAAQALGDLGSEFAAKYLLNAAKNNSEFVRCKAINALGKICCDDSFEFLMSLLSDEKACIREEASTAIENYLHKESCQKKLQDFFESQPDKKIIFEQLNKMLIIQLKMNSTLS